MGHGKPKNAAQAIQTELKPRQAYADPGAADKSLLANASEGGQGTWIALRGRASWPHNTGSHAVQRLAQEHDIKVGPMIASWRSCRSMLRRWASLGGLLCRWRSSRRSPQPGVTPIALRAQSTGAGRRATRMFGQSHGIASGHMCSGARLARGCRRRTARTPRTVCRHRPRNTWWRRYRSRGCRCAPCVRRCCGGRYSGCRRRRHYS